MGQQLTWGRRYLMVRPDHFRVDYAINPFMDPADQPDPVRTREQWDGLVGAPVYAHREAVGVERVLRRPDDHDERAGRPGADRVERR